MSQGPESAFKPLGIKELRNHINTWIIQILGRDRLEYLCSNTMNRVMQTINPFLWTYDLKATVSGRRQETPDVVSFELLPNQHWQSPRAGQYVELLLNIDSQSYERAYSISDICGDRFWITVKAHPQGKVSNWLHQHLQVGHELHLRGPLGQFVYRQQTSILLICAGSGITPCFSIVKDLLKQASEQRPQITLYAQFSRPADTIFAETLAHWRQAGLDIRLAYSQEPAAGDAAPLSAQNVTDLFADFQNQDIYLCGPEGLKQVVLNALEKAAFPYSRLHLENFNPIRPTDTQSHTLAEIYFSPYNYRLQMQESDRHKTLLQLGLEHGLNLEKGCCKGICGSCKLVLQQGEVDGQQQGKVVYLCSAYPRSAKVVLGY